MGEVPNRYNDEIRNFQADVQARNEKDAQWLSKLAVLGTGLQVFGKATGRNYFADIMNLAGQGSRYFSRIGKVADPEFTAETADLLYRKLGIHKDSGGEAFIQGFGGARVGDLDRVQDLAALMRLQTTAGFETKTKEIYELAKKDFQNLPRKRGGGTPSVFHHDIEPLTFGELIEHNHEFIENSVGLQFKFLKTGGNQKALSIGIVEDALESNLIYTNTIVDANLFVSRGSGKIVDLRMSKANFAIKQISEAIDIAGVGKALASFLGSGRRFSQITPDKGKADKFLIGTDVYTSAGKAGPIKTATNQTLGSVSDKRFVPSVLREHHDAGTIKNLHSAAPLKDSLVGQIQEATGVGPRFADKRSVGLPFVQAMLRNIKGIATGDAKFYAKDYVNASDTVKTRALSAMYPEEATTTVADLGTKGKFHGQGILKDTQKLTWWDKVKAYSGTSKDLIIVDKAAESAQEITSKHVYVNFGAKGVKPLENTTGMRAKTKGATGVDRMGNQTFHERVPNYATSAAAGDKIKDFGNYMSMRLNALASQSTGMGFRPTGNFKANVARLAAIPATLMVGKEVASYVNYEIGELTGTRPTDLIADAYTKARVLQQKIREGTGIQQAAAYSESSLFPGLSTGLMGTLASMAVGLKTLAMTGSPGKALAAAGALYGAAGGPDVAQTSDSLSREYSGEDKVAIRKARWWALGYQPFKGGEIDHFAPSWYRKLKDQPRDKNIYGSEGDYFQNVSLLPTPRNLFGLKKILDPYWLEKKNYYTRPYSQTGKMFDGVPIVGPVLSDTLGELIKPSKKMHPAQQERLVANANIREKGVPSDVASRMGIPGIPNALIDVNRPDVLADRVEKWSNVALEPTGIFKFVLGFFGVKLDENYKLADASNMDSMGRSFYDMNLGGLGGQTEFIRRFFMSDYSTPGKINQQINPIANAMPRWLPGSLGEEESDRGYFTDFTRGDAYTKISGGEYRLPGAGYEAVNRLHSGVSGVYDEVDKFMILADVAPNSTAFFKAQATVQNVEMTDYWRAKVEQATTQRDQKLDVFGFSSQDIVAKANLNPISQVIRSGWDTGYSALTEVPMLGSKLFPTRDPLQHYVKNKVEGDSYANWDNPYETIVRPAILDVAGTNPIGGAAKGAMLGALLASPGAKWLNPIAFTSRSMGVNAVAFGTAGGVASTTRMALTGNLSGGFTPFHVDDEREVNEYFDNLKYVKYSGLASIALNNGDTDHSEALTQVARRTNVFGLASLQSSGDPAAYRRSLSKTDKAYFDAFSSATSGRSDIMSYVPSHMRQALKATYEGPSGNVISADESAYASASEYFEDHTIPDDDSAVWHPSVPISAVKLKSVANGINGVSDSAHRFGFFPSQVRETNSRFPYVQPFESTDQVSFKNTAIGIADLFGEYIPFGNIKGLNLGIGPSMQLTNNEVYDSRREDVFSFFNTQYR